MPDSTRLDSLPPLPPAVRRLCPSCFGVDGCDCAICDGTGYYFVSPYDITMGEMGTQTDDLDREEWRSISSLSGRYEASSFGRVRSLLRAPRWGAMPTRVLTPSVTNSGYLMLRLFASPGAKPTNHYVHALVLEAFHGPRPEGLEASHLNGNRVDNRSANLRWETNVKNALRRFDHGTQTRATKQRPRAGTGRPRGHWKHGAKLSPLLVCVMRITYATGAFTERQLARWFGVGPVTAHYIISRRKWTHVEDDFGLTRAA